MAKIEKFKNFAQNFQRKWNDDTPTEIILPDLNTEEEDRQEKEMDDELEITEDFDWDQQKLLIKTYGEDHIDEQINKLNNLCSTQEDENDEEDDDEDDEEDEGEDDDDDEDYVPDLEDGSNHAYMFEQVKRIHKHVSNLLSYFTNTKATVKKSSELNCY